MRLLTILAVVVLLVSNSRAEVETVDPDVLVKSTFLATANRLSQGLCGYEAPVVGTDTGGTTACEYDDVIACDENYKYRSFDGSCNNLQNPFFGRTNTPFERLLVPKYEADSVGDIQVSPHSGASSTLIGPRELSTSYHQASTDADEQIGVKHITMTMGNFISHDLNQNTISTGPGGAPLPCCNRDGTANTDPELTGKCAHIPVPAEDPFFKDNGGRRCLNFARAQEDTDIRCSNRYRQQTNRINHFLDASTVYGSDSDTADNLRAKTDGLLKVGTAPQDNRDLLLQNLSSQGSFGCRTTRSSEFCFMAGDARVNENPMLTAMHTLFLREHNRVARELKKLNPHWDDEKLYQEARRIVIAEYQNIVYSEYLPALISHEVVEYAGLSTKSLWKYFTGYDSRVNPAIRNEFMAAGFRSGHSTINSAIAPGMFLRTQFFNPTVIYNESQGIDFVTRNLFEQQQQKMDRLKTDQVTNHLFEFGPGSGGDLAATNIQRGRDHGMPSYNDMRELCGLERATSFSTSPGGLVHHTCSAAEKLATVYENVDDIEAWTGMSSEKRLEGATFGPTAACITAMQFRFLKLGDRFYFENNQTVTQFTTSQLRQLRQSSMARIICDNTGISKVQKNPFLDSSLLRKNPELTCGSWFMPTVDLDDWAEY